MRPQRDHWPVGRLLSAAARRMERAWDAHLAAWDLNHASLPVLVFVAAGPMSQRELADACGVTEQTMSRVVARLERTGYVSRDTQPQDRRRHAVAITPAGAAALEACADPAPAQEEVFGHLSPERRALLGDLLREVVDPSGALPTPPRDVPAGGVALTAVRHACPPAGETDTRRRGTDRADHRRDDEPLHQAQRGDRREEHAGAPHGR